jgi:hypothetical protein
LRAADLKRGGADRSGSRNGDKAAQQKDVQGEHRLSIFLISIFYIMNLIEGNVMDNLGKS